MTKETPTDLPSKDITILRELARRKVEIAADPINLERKQAWYNLDSGENSRPMVLAQAAGVSDEKRPFDKSVLQCESEQGRRIEHRLRIEIYQFEELQDDHVVEPFVNIHWQVQTSNYGVEIIKHKQPNESGHGSYKVEPPIADLDTDFDKLSPRTYSVNRDATAQKKATFEELFDGILPIRIRNSFWWTFGLTWCAIDLIGLEELMLAMYDNPDGLHRLMTFLRDDHLAYAKWLEREGLLTLNNENDGIGSGSMGYTRRLPKADMGDCVRTNDLWLLLESQETVGVGPEQFQEFIFPYQKTLADKFGSVYYGCCEPVHTRWHVLEEISNLERVSVSPWCDQSFMAEACGSKVVYSRKPNPTQVSTERFNEDQIRSDLQETLSAARDCRLEIVMKDVHTLNNQPHRLSRWVALAREEIEKAGLSTGV